MTTSQAAPAQQSVRVFISYSHDSSNHSARVLDLAQRLRREGVDATIDRFVPFPKEGWNEWSDRQLEEADCTLCVCTEKYRIRFDDLSERRDGKGVRSEARAIKQYIHDNYGENSRFVPVVFVEDGPDSIPRVLKAYNYFVLYRQYDELYSLLTNQPVVSPEPLGPVRELPVISPGVPSAAPPLDAADAIESRIRLIAAGPGEAAQAALGQLEQMASSAGDTSLTDSIIGQLISYISALEASSTYPPDERLLRKNVVRALCRATGGKLNNYLPESALSGIDLALFDFRGADMSGVNFSGSSMIECDFTGVNLSRSRLADCRIRNARFDSALLAGVDFTNADWFNALGLNAFQLAASRTCTLRPSPAVEEDLHAFLDASYAHDFRSCEPRIQQELRRAWATYLSPGGLAGDVAKWAASFDRVRTAVRQLGVQSERFRTYRPNAHTQRVFLDLTLFPSVRRSLNELACVNPAKWPDPGWAVDFSATRNEAMRKLASAEASLDGDPSQQISDLLTVLEKLREEAARACPQMFDS